MTNHRFDQIHPSRHAYGMNVHGVGNVTAGIVFNIVARPLATREQQWWRSDPYLMFVTAEPILQRVLLEVSDDETISV